MESGGIGVRTVRDPVLAMYRWEVAVSAEPAKNLPLLTGQIINNISVALEYVAFQIYLIAGGEPDGPQAAKVAFPIVNTESPWDSVVKKKVPGVWPEAADRLKAAQPFSQEGMAANALRTLRGLGGTDKHRNLVLCAAVALSANVIGPAGGGRLPDSISTGGRRHIQRPSCSDQAGDSGRGRVCIRATIPRSRPRRGVVVGIGRRLQVAAAAHSRIHVPRQQWL